MDDALNYIFGVPNDGSALSLSTIRDVLHKRTHISETYKFETNCPNVTSTSSTIIFSDEETPGRIGPREVQLSRKSNLGPLLLSDDDTEVEAQCHLGSILATVCVFGGTWQYEATLGSAGVQQIGWAPLTCPFTNEEGVGDSLDSYAFDGNRIAKWHDGSIPYGQAWVTGDVIGSCIDLNNGTITYYRNGISMGVAFTRVRKGIGYFPATSLSYGERCQFNFGRRPFEYPVEGYSPLQIPTQSTTSVSPLSSSSQIESNGIHISKNSSSYFISCLQALLEMEHKRQNNDSDAQWTNEDVLIIASILFEYLGPMLQFEYNVVDVWYPFLVNCMRTNSVAQVISWMQLFMEPFELKSCFHSLFKYIGYKCRTTGLVQVIKSAHTKTDVNLEEPSPQPTRNNFPALGLLLDLLKITSIFDFALSLEDINQLMEMFITCKQPSKVDLAALLPNVWWPGSENEATCSEARFLYDVGLLNACVRVYEDLVYELISLLRSDTINSVETASSTEISNNPSSSFFVKWLNFILVKNKGATRNVVPPGLSPSSVLVNLYFALLRLLFVNTTLTFSDEYLTAFIGLFHKPSDPIVDFSRLGGTLGHLQKTIGGTFSPEHKRVPPIEVIMLDAAVLVYHLGVSSRFKNTSQQQIAVRQSLTRLNEAQARLRESDATSRLESTTSNLLASVADGLDGLRLLTYSRAVLVGDEKLYGLNSLNLERQRVKQEIMYKKTVLLADLVTDLSKKQSELSYLPEYYMESMVDCFHSLRRAVPPVPLTSDAHGLAKIITVLLVFFNDPRIVNPDIRDLLLQSIAVLMQYNEYVSFIENLHIQQRTPGAAQDDNNTESVQVIMVRGLLQTFDKKYWVTVTSILLRFWKGIGLGQISTEPSTIFRNIFKDIVTRDKPLLNTFLNNLFNLLNTTISEFSVMKLDAVQMSPNDVRKANFLFELSINLLRILEFISIEIPEAYLSELNMTRLVELLLLILTRTTIASEAARLDTILNIEPHVSRVWILAPLVGVILNLDSYSADSSEALVKALLGDASFKMEAFESLRNLLNFSHSQGTNNSDWLPKLADFVGKLKAHQAKQADVSENSQGGSAEMCSICYGAPIDTQFEPCKHSSCHKCISRHLLNNKRCFFCNADVTSTHTFSHD